MASLDFDKSLAIVIGINQYSNGIAPLRTAVSDAEAIAHTLQQDHSYQTLLLLDQQATLTAIQALIQQQLTSLVTANSRLLLYFAGHGIAQDGDDGPAGYLIPQDAIPGKVDSYLPMVALHDALTALPCRHFLAIFDCCFAGAFRWSSTRDIHVGPKVIHQERYDRFRQDPAWQVITSASYDQKAMDVLSLRDTRGETHQKGTDVQHSRQHSPFAAALLEALQGEADAFPPAKDGKPAGDGVITATELYLYLRDNVEPLTQGQRKRQTPELCPLRKHDKGEFIFLTPGHTLNLPPAPALSVHNNPYRGLESFEQADCELFFGRDKEIEQLMLRLDTPHPLTVVLGASGTGKSSLVKAGLLPRIANRTEANRAEFEILPVMRPGSRSLKSLAVTCAKIVPVDEAKGLLRQFAEDENALVNIVGNWRQKNPNKKLLLVIDQTEELITQATSPPESYQFQRLIKRVMAEHWECLWIIATLRLDFEAQFQDEALQSEWMDARFVIPPMGQAQLREAIEKPAAARVLYFEPSSLVDRLVEDVAQTPGALPLLSFTLSELYLRYLKRRSDNRALTEADYRVLGGVAGALTKRATQEYENLVTQDSAYERTVKHVMLRMLATEGGELARRRVSLSELVYRDRDENERVQQLLEKLIAARLIVRGRENQDMTVQQSIEQSTKQSVQQSKNEATDEAVSTLLGESYVEPAHDALVRGWDKLLRWKRENQETLALQRRLAPTAKEWQQQTGKPNTSKSNKKKAHKKAARGLLWDNNPRLGLLQETLSSEHNWLNKAESDFVESSLKLKRKKRMRLVGLVMTAFLALTGFSLGLSVLNRRLQNAGEEAFAKQLAATAQTLADRTSLNRTTGALLAVYAHKILADLGKNEAEVNQVLRRSLTIPRRKNLIHPAPVNAIDFSPDGQQIATASDDGMVRLWDASSEQLLFELSHPEQVNDVSFSPDGTRLATTGEDGRAQLWEVATGKESLVVELGDAGNGVSFSPNGQLFATASADRTAVIWDARTGEKRLTLRHDDDINAVSFSPDGKQIATASYDYTAVVWDSRNGEEIALFEHDDSVNDVSFSPDSKQLVTASGDTTVKVWEIASEREQLVLPHGDWVSGVHFSPDGRNLVTVSDDYLATIWDAKRGKIVGQLSHSESVNGVSFSPDGQRLATISHLSQMASIWAVAEALEQSKAAHDDEVIALNFSPNGQQVASASQDKTIRLWDSNTGLVQFTLKHEGEITSIHYSPDGQQIATASQDNTVRLWDTQTGQQRLRLQHNGAVNQVHYSPDGQQIATASQDNTVRLWDTQTGQATIVLKHEGAATGVQFNPDGQLLLSTGEDRQVRVWDLQTQEESFVLETAGQIISAQFSPDEDLPFIAIAQGNRNISIWNWTTNHRFELPHTLATAFSFSGDGESFATAGRQGEVRVWNIFDLEAARQDFDDTNLDLVEDWQTYIVNENRMEASFSHEGPVTAVRFSEDGQLIASASTDRTARLWHRDKQTPIASARHERAVNAVSLSPLGDRIATASADNTISIGWVESFALAEQVCQRLGSNLHPDDWERYIDDRAPEPICPNLPMYPEGN